MRLTLSLKVRVSVSVTEERLDDLLKTQRETNELLARLESVVRDHLDSSTGGGEELLTSSRQPRGLGHLIPYGDNKVHPVAPDPDSLVNGGH